MKKRKLHLSASAIAAAKACWIKFRNAYVLGIRPDEDSEPLRVGTNWHRLLEVVTMKPGSVCPDCAPGNANDLECPLCDGTGFLPDEIMTAVTRVLNKAYEGSYKDPEAIAVERAKLYYSLVGYHWYYTDNDGNFQEDVVTREQGFDMTLINPESGRSLPNVKLLGKIDKVINLGSKLAIKEHKSTSSSLDPDSDYWGHLNLDTQTTLYLYAIRRMQENGELVPWGIKETDPLINTIKYDVWHKPTIKPRKLTQTESKKFVETGEYFNQKFEVAMAIFRDEHADADPQYKIEVDITEAEVKPGAKEGTFQIRETSEMYGARLLADIGERPEFYFRCIELTKTNQEMEAFKWELLNIYRTMQNMIKTGHWYSNENHCEAKYKCDYIHPCYNRIEISEDNVPEGMKCIFKKKEEES